MNNKPKFTAIKLLSLILIDQIKNNNAPRLSDQILYGISWRLVNNAPTNVIVVATHFK